MKYILDFFNNPQYEFIRLLLKTFLVFIFLKVIKYIIMFAVSKSVDRTKKIFLISQRINIILNLVGIVITLVIWEKYFKDFITLLSFVSAGVTIALREIILNLFAGIYIKTSKPFKLEDRISIDDIKGDVVVINALSFKILEVGDKVNGEQSSGLIINIPNSYIFSKALKNYNTAFKYIWDEIVVKIPLDSDLGKNKLEILKIVNNNEIIETVPKKMKTAIKHASLDYRIYYNHLEPIIYTKVVDNCIELNVRFLVNPKKERIVEDQIWTNIISKYNEGKIDLFQKK